MGLVFFILKSEDTLGPIITKKMNIKKIIQKITLFLAFASFGALASEEPPKKRMKSVEDLTSEVSSQKANKFATKLSHYGSYRSYFRQTNSF